MGRTKFSKSERIRIAREYVIGHESTKEICARYGLKSHNLLCNWVKRYGLEDISRDNYVPLPPLTETSEAMKDKETTQETPADTGQLLERIAQLEKALKWEQMRSHALETLIDVAEEQGIKVRKKSGAKR